EGLEVELPGFLHFPLRGRLARFLAQAVEAFGTHVNGPVRSPDALLLVRMALPLAVDYNPVAARVSTANASGAAIYNPTQILPTLLVPIRSGTACTGLQRPIIETSRFF